MKDPSPLVTPFTIVIDNQEGLPYDFTQVPVGADNAGRERTVPTVSQHLLTGDYSIEGHEDRITIERKSPTDLYGSLTNGRARLKREIGRMKSMDFSCVLVEATWPMICNPAKYYPMWQSEANPSSIVGSILSWQVRFPWCSWFFAGDRRHAQAVAFKLLNFYWQGLERSRQ